MTGAPDLPSLAEALRSRLPADALSFDPDPRYAVDGLQPAFVVSPSTPEDVGATLAVAQESGAAVVPFGGGTQIDLGMPPERYDLALDLRRLDRVIEHEPADLTVTVQAGITLDRLAEILREHGQMLPLAPYRAPQATVGGVLATNLTSPWRHLYGGARDLVIGMTVALPDGSLVKSGGRVVKNVAGYDMAKLHIGALGTLGVIVQASFKVVPLPQRSASFVLDGSLSDLMSINARLNAMPLAGFCAALTKDASAARWRLVVGFSGGAGAVERSGRDVLALAPAAVAENAWRGLAAPLDAPVVARGSVPPAAVAEVCDAFAAAGAAVVADVTNGVVHGAWPDAPPADTLLDLRRRCVEAQGALVLERAPVDLKRQVDVWGAPRADFSLMRRLKEELDPRRVLNPGRYVSGI